MVHYLLLATLVALEMTDENKKCMSIDLDPCVMLYIETEKRTKTQI